MTQKMTPRKVTHLAPVPEGVACASFAHSFKNLTVHRVVHRVMLSLHMLQILSQSLWLT